RVDRLPLTTHGPTAHRARQEVDYCSACLSALRYHDGFPQPPRLLQGALTCDLPTVRSPWCFLSPSAWLVSRSSRAARTPRRWIPRNPTSTRSPCRLRRSLRIRASSTTTTSSTSERRARAIRAAPSGPTSPTPLSPSRTPT